MGVKKLNNGDWINYFPEGTRSRNGELGSTRLGIGKMIVNANIPPVVIPIVHQGLDTIIPYGTYIPWPGKKVSNTEQLSRQKLLY